MLNRKNIALICGLALSAQAAFADVKVEMTQKAALELLSKSESLAIVEQGMKDKALSGRASAMAKGATSSAAVRQYLISTLSANSSSSAAEKAAALDLINSFKSASASQSSLSQTGVAGVTYKTSDMGKNITLQSTVVPAKGTTAQTSTSANLSDEAILAIRNSMIVGDIDNPAALNAIRVIQAKPYIAGAGIVTCMNEYPPQARNSLNTTLAGAGVKAQSRIEDVKGMIIAYEGATGQEGINVGTLIEKCDMTRVVNAETARQVAQSLN